MEKQPIWRTEQSDFFYTRIDPNAQKRKFILFCPPDWLHSHDMQGSIESGDGEVRNFIQSHTIKNYYQMTNLVLNLFWIFFLVKKCHNCSPHATCINNECVCKPGFIGNGKHCQRKYSYRKNQTAITSCTTLTPTQNSNN